MIAYITPLVFVLALVVTGAAGCGRRLGSPEETFTVVLDRDDEHSSCGTVPASVTQRLEIAKTINNYKATGRHLAVQENITVPVYFWHTYTPGETPDRILTKEFIAANHFPALQHGFRQTPFNFELKDIQIVESAEYGHCERLAPSEYALKASLRAPGKDVLNIYICDSAASDSRYWSSSPIMSDIDPLYDGVVLRNYAHLAEGYKKINGIQNIVHETGHFLGLEHTFLGGCKAVIYNNLDAQVQGDGVDDTAQHDTPTMDISPGLEVCWLYDPPLDTCGNGIPDPVTNYMNYLPGVCSQVHGIFTPGQVERMVVQHQTFRLDNICRLEDVTCTLDGQCCEGLRCIGGNPQKMKCKGPSK